MAIAIVAAAAAAGVAWVMLGSSLLDTRAVQVAGTVELSDERVRAAAQVPIGRSLLLLDTGAIESRVARVGRVAAVEVSRSVTGTVHITVTERTPVALVRDGDEAVLVDATVTGYATVPAARSALPELRVPRVAPDVPAARAAVQVLTGLPPALRERVRVVSARSPTGVTLRLADGREVRWGSPTQADRKAAVLRPLLSRPGDVYDVSSPELPTVS